VTATSSGAVPSPKSATAVCVSFVPGSATDAVPVQTAPSLEAASGPASTAGATFVTVSWVLSVA
jgi:hypothetical protein